MGYVDLTPNAEETARLLGASPSLLHKPPIQYGGESLGNLADLGGLGSQVAARTAAWGTSRAANAPRAALGWGAFGGACRREGDLNFQTQFDPVGRVKSALTSGALGAAAQSVLGKATEWLAAQRGRPVGLSQILPPETRNGQPRYTPVDGRDKFMRQFLHGEYKGFLDDRHKK